MPRERCTISFRLAGVCRTCKRATWPAHIAPDLSVYCADCCVACRLDRGPLENPRAKASGRRAVRAARPGKGGDSGPPKTGPFCAATAPARDLARRGRHQGQDRGMPPEQSGPARTMALKRATSRAIAPAGGGGEGPALPMPRRAFLGPFLPLRGPLCAAIRPALPWPSSKRPAWPLLPRFTFRPQHAACPKGPVRLPPPALAGPAPPRAGTRKRFCARMFRA